jgi:NAD-dependent deacetylase
VHSASALVERSGQFAGLRETSAACHEMEFMREKVVVFTGAGVSVESGLRTFRDMGGYWHEYPIESVASPEGWRANPQAVLAFYNERRKAVLRASPNAAHIAIAALEAKFDVVVITQNIDDLHERAGSTNVLHVHGEILKARSSADPSLIYPLATAVIEMGQLCEDGSQLRPDVVWFGETVRFMDEAAIEFGRASRILTIGTSLSVYPAAGLVSKAKSSAEKYLVAPEIDYPPPGYHFFQGKAAAIVPHIANCWLDGRKPC